MLLGGVAIADSVLVRGGGQTGSGYAFALGKHCYVLTAAHVVSRSQETTKFSVSNQIGRVFDGRLAKEMLLPVDEISDLALLKLSETYKYYVTAKRHCPAYGSVADRVFSNPSSDEREYWYIRISSPAGGAEVVKLNELHLDASSAIIKELSPSSNVVQGDSGAAVFVSPPLDTYGLTSLVSDDIYKVRRAYGDANFVGILRAVDDGKAVIVPANTVTQYLANTLSVQPETPITIIPNSVEQVESWYGTAHSSSRRHSFVEGSGFVNQLFWEGYTVHLDFGERDTLLYGFKISTKTHPKDRQRLSYEASRFRLIEGYVSRYRPSEGDLNVSMPSSTPLRKFGCKEISVKEVGNIYEITCEVYTSQIFRSALIFTKFPARDIVSIEVMQR